MIETPGADVREYLRASGCLAVYALVAGNAVTFGASADPWAAAERERAELVEPIWIMGDSDEGAAVASRALEAHVAAWPSFDSPAGRARMALIAAATSTDFAPHDRIVAYASHAVGVVNAEYERMMRSGDMKPINKSYKAARLAGVKLPPFATFQRDYRLKMIRYAAKSGFLRAVLR